MAVTPMDNYKTDSMTTVKTANGVNLGLQRKSQVIPKMSDFGTNYAVFIEDESPEVIESRRIL